MQILAHRGYWNSVIPNNSPQALRMALENGYGFESDVRDYCGELVISHNIAEEHSQKAEEVFAWMAQRLDKYCFAINVKADGLMELLQEQLAKHNIKNYFLFDMSVPQTIQYAEAGMRFFTRQSEYETGELVLYDKSAGVWIDAFVEESWITEELLVKHIVNDKYVCLVSPDLHGRDYKAFWERLKSYNMDFSKVMLCTDYPDEAKVFFGNIVR